MRKVDSWETLPQPLEPMALELAAWTDPTRHARRTLAGISITFATRPGCRAGGCRTVRHVAATGPRPMPDGRRGLRRSPRRRDAVPRVARDIQHRPGIAICRPPFHGRAAGGGGADLDGGPRATDGQRHDRASRTVVETRVRLPERLRDRVRGPGRDRQMDCVPQHRVPHSALGGRPRSRGTGAPARNRRHDQPASLEPPRNRPGNGDRLGLLMPASYHAGFTT